MSDNPTPEHRGDVVAARICALCKAKVATRKQWLAEKCPAAKGGKSGHLISKPGLLKEGVVDALSAEEVMPRKTLKNWCGQCGRRYTTRPACGPTHAVMALQFPKRKARKAKR